MSIILQLKFGMQETSPIAFTPSAKEALNLSIKQHQIAAPKVRVGVKALGTFSTTYLLAFDIETADDHIFTIDGFTVLIAKKDAMFVMGLEIDYTQKGDDIGFVFNEPKT